MMVLRPAPVCGKTRSFADIAIVLNEMHIQLDSYSPGRNGWRQKVEDGEVTEKQNQIFTRSRMYHHVLISSLLSNLSHTP